MTEYLPSAKDRRDAIVSDKPDTKFYFESQKFSDIPEQQRPYANSYSQIHAYGAQEVRNNKDLIEAAAARYSINPDIVKAIIYTEASRGALYGKPAQWAHMAGTLYPGNISPSWQVLIPGSNVNNPVFPNMRCRCRTFTVPARSL